jgi:hypothetical protein
VDADEVLRVEDRELVLWGHVNVVQSRGVVCGVTARRSPQSHFGLTWVLGRVVLNRAKSDSPGLPCQ